MKTKLNIIMLFLVFLPLAVNAADEEKDYQAQIELAYMFGGQLYNDNFLYNPGISILGSYGKNIREKVYLGMGTGAMLFRDVTFVPLYIDFTGSRSGKRNTGIITMQLGYSLGWSSSFKSFNDCDLRGGVYVGAGLGRKFEVCDAFDLALFFRYRHQFARVEYKVFDRHEYSEEVNYDMLSFGVKFIL